MSAPPTRLQIAARMHELLLVEIGFGIEIERLLTRDRYARDVLLVCDACAGTELPRLAAEFRQLTPRASTDPNSLPAPGDAAPPADWSRDTSGFGTTDSPPLPAAGAPPPAPRPSGWRTRLPWR